MINTVRISLTRNGPHYALADGNGFIFARLENPTDEQHVRDWLADEFPSTAEDLLDGMFDEDGASA